MTNEKAIKALKHTYGYVAPNNLEAFDYAIKVLEKLEEEGISNPLETDFSSVKESN